MPTSDDDDDRDDGDSATGAAASDTAGSTGSGTTTALDDTGDSGSSGDTSTTSAPTGDDTGEPIGCACALDWIWIANAEQSTLSKIDTATLTEAGRYLTRADGQGDPSRTSVNLAGDVAVANRAGGLTKFYADPVDCADTNGQPGIQTSSGADDVLDWDTEECRAWHTEFPTTNQRPVAWTPGTPNEQGCGAVDQQLWTVASAVEGIAPGVGGIGGVNVYLVDGETGAVAESLLVETFSGAQLGAYGGAVDVAGNLWFSPIGALDQTNPLTRVELDTLEVTHFDFPSDVAAYGITVDRNDRVWVSSTVGSSAARFDPSTEVWDVLPGQVALGGLAQDAANHMWVATEAGAISYDIDTLMEGNGFVAPNGGGVKGIAVDAEGFVWAVNEAAWKIDPDSGMEVGSYDGLTGPYTYSDMTGWGLANNICPER